MSSVWDKLREFDGSLDAAFEELCAQLARIESGNLGHAFVRNGKPDGGLECLATRNDGTVIGWQAKWFRSPPKTPQWAQITSSLKSALAAYPKLTEFIVCLPQDRANSGGSRKLTMEQWNAHVNKWKAIGRKCGRVLEVTYWGTSELIGQLRCPAQIGRERFWFDRESFGPDWFRQQFEIAREDCGKRYRPELHFNLETPSFLAPLLQTRSYVSAIRSCGTKLDRICKSLDVGARSLYGTPRLRQFIEQLNILIRLLPREAETPLPFNRIRELLDEMKDVVRKQIDAGSPSEDMSAGKEFRRKWYDVYSALNDLWENATGDAVQINEQRAVIVIGDAGSGKTHALFHLIDELSNQKRAGLVITGAAFGKGPPWDQLIRHLGLTCGRDEFLGALNAAGEADQSRALIIVDALNECEELAIWNNHLSGMLQAIRRFPFVSIALSVRREFADDILPPALDPSRLVRYEHYGFQGNEAIAAEHIFAHYGLASPQIPILNPEFANPLLVITLAESLKNAGHVTIPPGAGSLRWIFSFWLDQINSRLSQSDRLDFDPTENRVQEVTSALANAMAKRRRKFIPEQDAKRIINAHQREAPWLRSMYRALLEEDVIQRIKLRGKTRAGYETHVRFTFDRFADQSIVESCLQSIPDNKSLEIAFTGAGHLRRLLSRQTGGVVVSDPGLLLAFAIEIPENSRYQCELTEVFRDSKLRVEAIRAVINSLQWRTAPSIRGAALKFFKREMQEIRTANIEFQCEAIERAIRLATRPDHPLNALLLDVILRSDSMPTRDYWWSRPLTRLDAAGSAASQLINWMSQAAARYCDVAVARIAAITACWMLATSNRFIRDRATKALVSMLVTRPSLACELVIRFMDVDDPYVLERVLAVAYGVALRTHEMKELEQLASAVFEHCFVGGRLPEHLLARDYARGIVETAIRRGVFSELDSESIRPPYLSNWPSIISRDEEWDQRLTGNPTPKNIGLHRIWNSVSDWGDFGRYVIGTNSGRHDWLRYRLSDEIPTELIPDERSDEAERLLRDILITTTEEQTAQDSTRYIVDYTTPSGSPPRRHASSGRSLTPSEMESEAWFPLEQVRCMVMDDVLALGYVSRLDEDVVEHDFAGRHPGRLDQKSERIGKKYQWIAYHRTRARIADNFRFAGESRIRPGRSYEGPWQVRHGRDIDPSCLISRKSAGRGPTTSSSWWAPFFNTGIDNVCDDLVWLRDKSHIPCLEQVSEAIDPATGRRWIIASEYVDFWPNRPDGSRLESERSRRLFYGTDGVLVRHGDSKHLVQWLNTQRLRDDCRFSELLPERQHLHECFLGEFPNSPAWDAENTPYFGRNPWQTIEHSYKWPVPCSQIAEGYFDDRELNCGRDEVLQFWMPSAELVTDLGLRHTLQDGHFENDGNLIAWDPSITQIGPSALLIDRDALLEYLRRKGLHLVLLVYGQKHAYQTLSNENRFLGNLQISGVLLHDGIKWTGSIDARFVGPD